MPLMYVLILAGGTAGLFLWAILLKRRLVLTLEAANRGEHQLQQALFAKEKAELELAHATIHFDERVSFLAKTHETLEARLKGLCTDVLQQSNQTFLTQAQSLLDQFQLMTRGELGKQHEKLNYLVAPVAQALAAVDEKIQTLEKLRVGAYEALTQQLQTLASTHKDLYQQTHQLVQALRTPHLRGRWGEIQLRRLVEIAGMLPHCDFDEQKSIKTEEVGRSLRPDLVIKLPGEKSIVIDAKVPLLSYMAGIEATENLAQKKHMKDHATQMRLHIKALSQKTYWAQLTGSPEFVLLFLPSESLLTAALEEDREILDYGAESRVLIATPMTLLALLKTIALGWHNQSLSENAQKISTLGRELHRRLNDMTESFSKIGQHLGLAVSNYNATLSTMEEKIFPHVHALGKFTQAGTSQKELKSIPLSIAAIPHQIVSQKKILFSEQMDETMDGMAP